MMRRAGSGGKKFPFQGYRGKMAEQRSRSRRKGEKEWVK
jgi:hypothetical protein